jgi:signal transduction histidine kinase
MMNDSLSELAGVLDRCQTGIAAVIRPPVSLPQWAAGLADLLLELLPQASLAACHLRGEGSDGWTIRPGGDALRSEIKRLVPSHLSSLNPLAPGVQKLPAEALPGLHLLATAIHENERPMGFLVVGLPSEVGVADRGRTQAVLTVAAPTAALRWLLAALRREQAELARFALVGQAFAGLGHGLNNALNSMLLQTSVVQLRVDPQLRQELAVIRQHGTQAASLVRSLQHVVLERREKSYAVDLDSVLAEVLEEEADLSRRLSVTPTTGETLVSPSLRIQSTRSAVKLLVGVCAATNTTVKVATGETDGGPTLSLTIADAAADIGSAGDPAAAETFLWQNLDEVSRHAGQSLLRQLGSTLTAERVDGGTLLLRVVWQPPA